jgi:L,D-transpeptidase catalytic domain/Putative peptidoglycan binding domain
VLRLVPLLIFLAWPTGGLTATPPVLTLNAPPATRFGHRIVFAGRIAPAVTGARIRLYRRAKLITLGASDASGAFRIPVRLERPGPFHVAWDGIESRRVTIRIHPLLSARLVGPRVVGKPLAVAVRVQPGTAGPIRVRATRNGRALSSRLVYGAGKVGLTTDALGDVRVHVETVPEPGYATASRELNVALRPPLLVYGASSPAVAQLLHSLAALHYAVPGIQSSFDNDVLESVYAFQKVQGLARTGTVGSAFWSRLEQPVEPRPRYKRPASHIEVSKARQVLYVVRGGRIVLISPVSTAGIPGYYTPVGRFAIYRKVPGYDPSPLGVLYKPMYFTGGYAIHGNPSVPPYPASHGCVRVPNFVIERLFSSERYGETVYVY